MIPRFCTAEHSARVVRNHYTNDITGTGVVLTQVFHGTNFLGFRQSFFVGDRVRVVVEELVLPQITLEGSEHQFDAGAVLRDLFYPFARHVLERIATVNLVGVNLWSRPRGAGILTLKQSIITCVSS